MRRSRALRPFRFRKPAGRWGRVIAVAALLVAACVPVEAPGGPEITQPALQSARLLAADGTELPLRLWLPPDGQPVRAAVVALHGFNDYSNFFDTTGRSLAERGIASFAYDQRGFGGAPNRGLWPGSAALTSDLRSAVAAVRARYPGVPVYAFGESMGGAVILAAMGRPDPPRVDGVILAAPAVWGRSSMPWYQTTALWIAVHTLPGSELSGSGLGIVASDNTEMLRALGRDPMVIKGTRVDAVYGLVNLMDQAMASAPASGGRMLVLYGEHDQLIPPGAIEELLRRLPPQAAGQQRLALYPDGYHMLTRDLHGETVQRDIAAWILNPQAALPSGADVNGASGACPDRTVCAIVPSGPSLNRHS